MLAPLSLAAPPGGLLPLSLGRDRPLDPPKEIPAPTLLAGQSRYDDWSRMTREPTGACISPDQKKSQLRQDMLALEWVNCTRGGYYVDIGANDGETLSNTFVMDKTFGWQGLCLDPFPTQMEVRSCKVLHEVVSDVAGEAVQFRHKGGADDNDVMGGIDDTLDEDDRHQGGTLFNFTTTTATRLLQASAAPKVIDFVSIDVEGAEVKVLQGLDLDAYCVRFLTIEHNFDEPKRSDLRDILVQHGYQYFGHEPNYVGKNAAGNSVDLVGFDDYYTKQCA